MRLYTIRACARDRTYYSKRNSPSERIILRNTHRESRNRARAQQQSYRRFGLSSVICMFMSFCLALIAHRAHPRVPQERRKRNGAKYTHVYMHTCGSKRGKYINNVTREYISALFSIRLRYTCACTRSAGFNALPISTCPYLFLHPSPLFFSKSPRRRSLERLYKTR